MKHLLLFFALFAMFSVAAANPAKKVWDQSNDRFFTVEVERVDDGLKLIINGNKDNPVFYAEDVLAYIQKNDKLTAVFDDGKYVPAIYEKRGKTMIYFSLLKKDCILEARSLTAIQLHSQKQYNDALKRHKK